MMDMIFTLLVAGCLHDGARCDVLVELPMHGASRSQCEARLDRELAAQRAEFPVFSGICIESPGREMARLPRGWSRPAARLVTARAGETQLGRM